MKWKVLYYLNYIIFGIKSKFCFFCENGNCISFLIYWRFILNVYCYNKKRIIFNIKEELFEKEILKLIFSFFYI